jgi:hypothetical protein
MFNLRVCQVLVLGSLCGVFLTGCAPGGNGARGIDPVLKALDVQAGADNSRRILLALAVDNGIDIGGSSSWYSVAEAGFNYVDDQCATYFDTLFFLNRDRELTKNAISAVGQTSSAILGVTHASKITLSIVAQAFGLGVTGTDLIGGSFLYQLPPSTTYGFVKQMQQAYRDAIAQSSLGSSAAAYHAIQGYISLCLPPTIEANVTEHVATAKTVALPSAAGGNVTLVTGSKIAGPESLRILATPRARLAPPVINAPPPLAVNSYERRLPRSVISDIQRALCVSPTGELGAVTRQAVADFLTGMGRPRPEVVIGGILPKDQPLLDEAISEVKDCKQKGFSGPLAVGQSLS